MNIIMCLSWVVVCAPETEFLEDKFCFAQSEFSQLKFCVSCGLDNCLINVDISDYLFIFWSIMRQIREKYSGN